MAVKSIVDIEINDDEFKDFAATFAKYQEALAKTPKSWDEAGKSQRSTVLAFQGIAAALLAQSALQAKRLKTLKDEAKVEKESSSYWKDMVRSSREVASNAASIAKSVLSTIGIGSIFSGLLGAGGIYGLDALAGSVGNSRRTALGLGSTIGETRAFGLNYGRIVDPGSVIGGVNDSLLDVSRRSDLYLAGLTEGDLKGKDAAQVASLLISKFKARVDQTNPLLYGSLIKDFGYGNLGLTVQDAERARNTPASEINEYGRAFGRDAKRLNILDPQAKRFQDFDVQLHRAGEQIENVFIRGISPLIPALTKFSESVITTVSTFADRLINSGALDKFAGAIQGFADYLGTKNFQDDVATFAEDVVILGKAVHSAIQYFGGLAENKPSPNNPYSAVHTADYPNTPLGWLQWLKARAQAGGLGIGKLNSDFQTLGWGPAQAAAMQGNLQWESGGDPGKWGDFVNGKPTAYGLAQWHRAGWDEYARWAKATGRHSKSIYGSTVADQEAFLDYQLRHGSEQKAGQALLTAKDIAAATRVFNHAFERPADPSSTDVRRFALALKSSMAAHVIIKVDNNTGGNVITSANQLRPVIYGKGFTQ